MPTTQLSDREGTMTSKVAKWIGAGLVAGLVGGGIWAAVAYGTNSEFGWIAWGIGGLVGFAVRLAAQEDEGPGPGITAVLIALLSIVGGKYAAVSLIVASFDVEVKITPDDMIQQTADTIVKERQAKGKRIAWPAGVKPEEASEAKDYPPDVWREATQRWQKLPPDEQKRRMDQAKQEYKEVVGKLRGALHGMAVREMFGPFDILWFLLASLTAYRLGSGMWFQQG